MAVIFIVVSICFSCYLSLCVTALSIDSDRPLRTLTSSEHFLADIHLVHLGGFKMPFSPKIPPQCMFSCPECPSIFNRMNNLRSHMKHECGKPPRFGCPYCTYTSKKASNIRAHVRTKHYGFEVKVIHVQSDSPLTRRYQEILL